MRAFYARLLAVLGEPVLHEGTFVPLEVRPAGEGDRSYDSLVAFAWREADEEGAPRLVVVVNLSREPAWARIPLAAAGFVPGAAYRLLDRLDGAAYPRPGEELCGPGLLVALRPRQSHLFVILGA